MAIEITVYYPKTAEKQALLEASVSKLCAEYALQSVEKLDCSKEQKLKLLDAVVQTILATAKETNNA